MKDFTIESLAIALGRPLPVSDTPESNEGLQEAPESKEAEMRKLLLMSSKTMDYAFHRILPMGDSQLAGVRNMLRRDLEKLEAYLMLPWDRYQNLKREMEWE